MTFYPLPHVFSVGNFFTDKKSMKMREVILRSCKKASEQWVMCKEFFGFLHELWQQNSLLIVIPENFLENTSRKHRDLVQERIWGENRSQMKERMASENGTDTGIHDSVV